MISNAHYTITVDNIARHEWMGLTAIVKQTTDASRKGLTGVVVDETKNTVVLATANGRKVVPKNESVLAFKIGDSYAIVDAKTLVVTPEERLRVTAKREKKGFE